MEDLAALVVLLIVSISFIAYGAAYLVGSAADAGRFKKKSKKNEDMTVSQ